MFRRKSQNDLSFFEDTARPLVPAAHADEADPLSDTGFLIRRNLLSDSESTLFVSLRREGAGVKKRSPPPSGGKSNYEKGRHLGGVKYFPFFIFSAGRRMRPTTMIGNMKRKAIARECLFLPVSASFAALLDTRRDTNHIRVPP